MKGVNWHFGWRLVKFDTSNLMVIIKDLNLYNQFIYCTVTILYMFHCVSCVYNIQLPAGVELLQYFSISVLCFLVVVEMLGR